MNEFLKESITNSGVKFPTRIEEGFAENMSSIASSSVDTVVSTHVLCSVQSPVLALAEITRILKPGGKFLFFEHVKAPHSSWTCTIQESVSPLWRVIGDGCEFRNLEADLRALEKSGLYERVQVENFEMEESPLPLVKPHIRGYAMKKSLPSGQAVI